MRGSWQLNVVCILFSLSNTIQAQTDNGDECSCFRTNGSSVGYFTYHRFHDFRDVSGGSTIAPSLITNQADTSSAVVTSDFFNGDAWLGDWTVQNWTNAEGSSDSIASDATVLMANSPNNVYIETANDSDTTSNTYLTLRTSRLSDFQSAAEFDSTEQNFHYLSARFLARVVGADGACAGMFTYLDSDPVQEADIEILTSGARTAVQYTNQPSVDKKGNALPKSTVNSTIPNDIEWSNWNIYRMDWMPKATTWYVNNENVATISFQVPKKPSGLIVNMWSDGGSWTGNMTEDDEAFLQIQWIELAYNTSGAYGGSNKRDLEKRKSKGCKVVCGVDENVNVTGTPGFLFNKGSLGWKEGTGKVGWIPVVVIGLGVLGWF